jgi:D-alanyl-D-alanine carboxypeptidase
MYFSLKREGTIMKRSWLRVQAAITLTVVVLAITLSIVPLKAFAADLPMTYLVVDVNNGKVLSERGAREKRFPASLTKMMTLYVLFDALDAGKVKLTDRIMMSENAASEVPSKLSVGAGNTITVEDAIRALAIKSANDVATAVAEHLGGSERGFADMMNQAARQMGMLDSHFANANGLNDNSQVTTAYDMYVLGLSLQDRFPRYYRYFGESSFSYRGKTVNGHNPFLGWRGVDGIKTGYTQRAGHNLVSNMSRDSRHIVAVVLSAPSGAKRNDTMSELLTRGIAGAQAGARRTKSLNQDVLLSIKPARVTGGSDLMVSASPMPNTSRLSMVGNGRAHNRTTPATSTQRQNVRSTPRPVARSSDDVERDGEPTDQVEDMDRVMTESEAWSSFAFMPPDKPDFLKGAGVMFVRNQEDLQTIAQSYAEAARADAQKAEATRDPVSIVSASFDMKSCEGQTGCRMSAFHGRHFRQINTDAKLQASAIDVE